MGEDEIDDMEGWDEEKGKDWAGEYNEVLDSMMKQIDGFQSNVAQIKDRFLEIVQENTELSTNLKDVLFSKVRNGKFTGNNQEPFHVLADNLLQHLDLASQEKQILIDFCKVVIEKLEHLEEEFVEGRSKELGHKSHAALDNLRKEYTDVIRILETQLNSLRLLVLREREKHQMCVVQTKRVEEECERVRLEALEARAKADKAEESEGEHLKVIDDLKGRCLDLEEQLLSTLRREESAVSRVEEALKVADAASFEKDQALMQEAIAKEEVSRFRKTIDELVEDAGVRVTEEVETAKKHFNLRIQEILGEMALKEKERERLLEELEESKKKREALEMRLEKLTESRIEEAKGSDDGAYIAALCEQISWLREEVAREREAARRAEREKRFLEKRLGHIDGQQSWPDVTQSLKSELEVSEKSQAALLQCAEELKEQIRRLENSHTQGKMNRRSEESLGITQKPIIITLSNDILKSPDLQEMMSAQLEMKQKWKQEATNLSLKLGKRIRELRAEVMKLRLENKGLRFQLKKN